MFRFGFGFGEGMSGVRVISGIGLGAEGDAVAILRCLVIIPLAILVGICRSVFLVSRNLMIHRFYGVSLGLFIVTCVSGWYFCSYEPRNDCRRLLAGDKRLNISCVVSPNFGKRVTVSDAQSTEYMTKIFQSARQREYVSGVCLAARVHFSNGNSTPCTITYGGDRQIGLSFGDTLFPDASENYYALEMPEPVPEELSRALAILLK
jgi:hypothetical protein